MTTVLADFNPVTLAQQFAACGYKSSHVTCVLRVFYAGDDTGISPLQSLDSFGTINPGRCPGLSSVGLTALADEIAHTAVRMTGSAPARTTSHTLGDYFEVLAAGLRFALLAE